MLVLVYWLGDPEPSVEELRDDEPRDPDGSWNFVDGTVLPILITSIKEVHNG